MQSEQKQRPNLFVRHARLTASVWFAAAAYIAGCIVCRLFLGSMDRWVELAAAASALLPAAWFAPRILDSAQRPPVWQAAGAGANIVLTSHAILSTLMAFSYPNPIPNMFLLLLMSLVFAGWVTVPIGCAFASVLSLLCPKPPKTPKGCALHGYTRPPLELNG